MARYYRDSEGNYLGAFDSAPPVLDTDGEIIEVFEVIIPAGAIEVAAAPSHGSDIFTGGNWVATQARLDSDFEDARKSEYEKEGVSIEAMIVAMWENDPQTIAALEAKRQAVKLRVPKNI